MFFPQIKRSHPYQRGDKLLFLCLSLAQNTF